MDLILFAILLAVWAATLWFQWSAASRAAAMPEATCRLLETSLADLARGDLLMLLAGSASASLAANRVVVFAREGSGPHQRWFALSPELVEASVLDEGEGDAMARVADSRAVDRRTAGSSAGVLDRWGLSILVPVYASPRLAVVVGARSNLRARSTPVRRWHLCARAVVDAHATRAAGGEELTLVNQANIARALEDVAMSSTASAPSSALDWMVRFYSEENEACFLATYALTSTRTVAVFGRATLSGASASLFNVSIKSFCDVVVRRLGSGLDGEAVLKYLNRFLWRPTRPVGAYCHVADFDIGRDRVEVTSAGHTRLLRARSQSPGRAVELHSCFGEPIGASEAGRWRRVVCELQPGDAILLVNDENDVVGMEDRHLRIIELLRTVDDVSAAALLGHAVEAGIEAQSVMTCTRRRTVEGTPHARGPATR